MVPIYEQKPIATIRSNVQVRASRALEVVPISLKQPANKHRSIAARVVFGRCKGISEECELSCVIQVSDHAFSAFPNFQGDTTMENEMWEMMTCTICADTISSRPRITTCGHYFCSSCITKWYKQHGSCPNCRTPFGHVDALDLDAPFVSENRPLWRLLQFMPSCRCKNDGCCFVGTFGERLAHQQTCIFERSACPHRKYGCTERPMRKDSDYHLLCECQCWPPAYRSFVEYARKKAVSPEEESCHDYTGDEYEEEDEYDYGQEEHTSPVPVADGSRKRMQVCAHPEEPSSRRRRSFDSSL